MDLEILDLISQTRVEIQDIRNKYNTALYDSSLIMAMNKSIQEPQHKVYINKGFCVFTSNLGDNSGFMNYMYF